MKTNRLYIVLIVVLILLNGALMWTLMGSTSHQRKGHKRPRPGAFKKEIIHDLSLDEAQIEKFKESVNTHRIAMQAITMEESERTWEYFEANLKEDSLAMDEALSHILKFKQQKLEVSKIHFDEIKSICREDQMAAYNVVIRKATRRLLGSGSPGPPRGGPPH